MSQRFLEQMSMYSSYHRHRWNRRLHYVGVPSITLGLLLVLAMVQVGQVGFYPVSVATAFAAVVMSYWVILDRTVGLLTIVAYLPLVFGAGWLAGEGPGARWTAFGILFLGGWMVQLVGHQIEGRKPALLDNLAQIFIAPVFLTAETMFALGQLGDLRAAIDRRWPAYLDSADRAVRSPASGE